MSQGARLTERERAAAVERKGQLFEELGLNLSGRKPHGIHNLGRYFQDELRHRRSPSGPIVAGSLSPSNTASGATRIVLAGTTRDDPALIVGRAGAGKTTAAVTMADAYREAGYDVVSAALAGRAADTLQQEAGIHFRILNSLEHSRGRGEETLDHRMVLVIDEAGMVDAPQLS